MKILSLVLALLAPSLAFAEADYCESAVATAVITVATQTPTSMLPAGGHWKSITIDNINATDALSCSESVSVSTMVASANQGQTVAKSTYRTFMLVPKANAWYCLTANVTAAVRAIVTACR